jgi:hypothetical protein
VAGGGVVVVQFRRGTDREAFTILTRRLAGWLADILANGTA